MLGKTLNIIQFSHIYFDPFFLDIWSSQGTVTPISAKSLRKEWTGRSESQWARSTIGTENKSMKSKIPVYSFRTLFIYYWRATAEAKEKKAAKKMTPEEKWKRIRAWCALRAKPAPRHKRPPAPVCFYLTCFLHSLEVFTFFFFSVLLGHASALARASSAYDVNCISTLIFCFSHGKLLTLRRYRPTWKLWRSPQ